MDCEQARADFDALNEAVKVVAGMVAFVDAEHPHWHRQAIHDGGRLLPATRATLDAALAVLTRRNWATRRGALILSWNELGKFLAEHCGGDPRDDD